MIAATALASIALFVVAFWFLGVVPAASKAAATAQRAVGAMRDGTLDDRAREAAMQRASIDLFRGFFSILGRGLLALAAAAFPIWALDALGLGQAQRVIRFLSRWDVILLSTGGLALGYLARTRLWRSN